jgi:hypothetical protein
VGGPVSPLATWLVPHGWLFAAAAWGTVLFELGAPLALREGRVRTAWILGVWGMHVGILAMMGIAFAYPLSGVAFAAFVPMERWWGAARRAARRRIHRT